MSSNSTQGYPGGIYIRSAEKREHVGRKEHNVKGEGKWSEYLARAFRNWPAKALSGRRNDARALPGTEGDYEPHLSLAIDHLMAYFGQELKSSLHGFIELQEQIDEGEGGSGPSRPDSRHQGITKCDNGNRSPRHTRSFSVTPRW
ncbi:predicted protein [Chaetomium globosum CBS 148.51]|uniref:Uncharacterized protein n=1 Tax=Chaetomium globosum (strain ATCC 6205 / CBS 148.51 / DSM 1962 / NBRC 6347 / NRRL 1970) TaxID=306901 RepID=Q2HDA0_CHAGB|nr:uncharacterized protein CHGG_01804 [Chaetomium globosum CBS 148.51]EAQ93569.1 predicted protein [Chaetomium globosum CBS 148.51]